MKWSKLLLVIAIVLFALAAIVIFLRLEKPSLPIEKQNDQNNNQSYENTLEPKLSSLDKGDESAKVIGTSSNDDFLSMAKLRKLYPDGVRYLNIDSANLSTEQKAMLKKDLENLAKYGSFDGNAPDQNEFKDKDLDLLRKMVNENKKLSFSPIEENRFIPTDLRMTGKYYSGTYNETEGFDSYSRLYESTSNGKKIEVSEMYLNPNNNTVLDVFKESRNADIDGISMTWQTKPSPTGNNYTADFVIDKKKYSISTAAYSEIEAKQIVSNLIKAAR